MPTTEPLRAGGTGPVAARETLEVAGLKLAYRERGPASAEPVVVLHGWGASIDAVVSIQDGLAAELRVIAFDLPGFGASDPPPGAWGTPDYAELVRSALDRVGLQRVNLLGHSFGGKVSLFLAARWPERVERLVLVNSAGVRLPPSPTLRARIAAFKVARRLLGNGPVGRRLLDRFGSTDYRQAGPMRSVLVKVVNENYRSLLRQVQAPTLLVWGDRDEETSLACAAIMEREIPDAGLVVFPGAGHFSYADDLPRFLRVVSNFLKA